MKRIVTAGAKGGVGKSTAALNLTGALTRFAVELVDLDPSSSLTLAMMGESHPDPIHAERYPLPWADVRPQVGTFRPSGRTMVRASRWDMREHLRAQPNIEVQIVDLPPTLDERALEAVLMADLVLVPLSPQPLDLPSLWDVLEVVRQLKAKAPVRALLNRVQSRRSIVGQVIEAIDQEAPGVLLKTMIPEDVRVAEAPGASLPVEIYAPTSRGAEAYRALAKEIMR
ncbi:MAG: ParA family protein [Rhodospirillaceae bacterium]